MSVELPAVIERADLDLLLQQHASGVVVLIHLCADEVNHEYGRAAGDAVLVAFDLMLHQALSPSAESARTAGQQFLIILPDDDAETSGEMLVRLHDLWDRRTPHACSFLACATTIDTSARAAFQLIARARPRQVSDAFVTGHGGAAASADPTVDDLTIVVTALRGFLRAETREQVERAFRVAAVALSGGYLDVDAIAEQALAAPVGLTAELIGRLRVDANHAINALEARAMPRTRRTAPIATLSPR